MADLGNVVYNENDLKDDFQPIPDGFYNVMVTESAKTETKTGGNHYLKMTLKVIDGPSKDRVLFVNLNLWHNGQAKPGKLSAKQIAEKELNKIRFATGKLNASDSAQLHGIPFQVKVVVDGDFNKIKAYNPLNQSTQQSAPSQTVGDNAPSFLKN